MYSRNYVSLVYMDSVIISNTSFNVVLKILNNMKN
jgi:hypothetical protein